VDNEIALSADSEPHFTTIADFVSTVSDEIDSVFADLLTVCQSEGLMEKAMPGRTSLVRPASTRRTNHRLVAEHDQSFRSGPALHRATSRAA
jgi:hypothetical protein